MFFLFHGRSILNTRKQANFHMKKTFIILSAVIIFVGCASRKTTSTSQPATAAPTAEEAAQAHMKKVLASFPNYTLEDFNSGKTLYEKNCSTCHMLHNPSSQNEFAWNEIVPDMVKKSNRKGTAIDSTQQDLILKYVVSLSKNPN